MTDYSYVASYDVIKVLWQQLQSNNLLSANNYYADGFMQPLMPIIPAQQVPEFNNLLPGKTYLIYDVVQKILGVQWWIFEDTITFNITSRDQVEIRTLINWMIDFFRRYEKTANEFNSFLPNTSIYNYLYFHIDSVDPVQAFHDEGGFMNGMISITYAYTREVDQGTGKYT
jgi:hypothetical protein